MVRAGVDTRARAGTFMKAGRQGHQKGNFFPCKMKKGPTPGVRVNKGQVESKHKG